MDKPIINRRVGGEYSTIVLPNGIIETMWFGDDGSQRFVARTVMPNPAIVAKSHISADN